MRARRVGAVVDRTPLQVSLVALLLVVVGGALLLAGVAATTSLNRYLLDRVDAQLEEVTSSVVDSVQRRMPSWPDGSRDPYRLPSQYVIQVNDADGSRVTVLSAPVRTGEEPPSLPGPAVADLPAGEPEPYTVSVDGKRWRMMAVPFTDGSGTLTVATSLTDETATVARLAVVEIVIGLLVMALLGVVGWFMVRRSLRPLADVERTAAAISGGDLSVRVPHRDPRTEVGRVSQALNTMLEQVESSFEAQAASEAEARASEDRMRRFVADASHELRTPLTSIRGFSELYRRGALEDPQAVSRAMGRIEAEAARMGVLVDDLLLLARLDQQRPLEQLPVDLLAVASDAVADARATAPGRPISLEILPGSRPPVIVGDEARLRQVVANLVSNALVHTPSGAAVTVRVGTSGDRTALEVADTGPGLNAEESERLFERFYRGDPARTRASGGSGLGLAIVSALVTAHNGTIRVTSEPGVGTTFRVELPTLAEAVAE